jgi:cobalamin biosynthesis protein CbiG
MPERGAVVGVGMSSSATALDVQGVTAAVLADAGLDWPDVAAVATLDTLAADPRLAALGCAVVGFPADRLAAVPGVTVSRRARGAVGTGSVAEAAALLGAGFGGRLIVRKRRAATVTAAVAVGPAHP